MTCYRGDYESYLYSHGGGESELPDIAVFFNTNKFDGGIGNIHFAKPLSVLAGVIGRGVVGLITGSRESCARDFIVLQQLGWGKGKDNGMGCGKLITDVEKNDLSPDVSNYYDDENDAEQGACNNFYFVFECQGWSNNEDVRTGGNCHGGGKSLPRSKDPAKLRIVSEYLTTHSRWSRPPQNGRPDAVLLTARRTRRHQSKQNKQSAK